MRITPSWSGQSLQTKADAQGHWLTQISTPQAGYTPYDISFDDGDGAVKVQNILIGGNELPAFPFRTDEW